MDEQLRPAVAYIQQHLQQGFSEQEIRTQLLAHGWTEIWINQAFDQATVTSAGGAASSVGGAVVQSAGSPAPAKYRVFAAMNATWRALRTSLGRVLILLVLGVVAIAVSQVLVSLVGGYVVFHNWQDFSLVHLLVSLLLLLLLFLIFSALASAFMQAVVAGATDDGFEGRRVVVSATLRRAAATMIRLMLTNTLVVVFVGWPVLVALVVPYIVLWREVNYGLEGTLTLFILVGLALWAFAIVWLLVFGLRFALAGMVSFFEPNVPIRKTLKRSSYLLRKGGRWFLFKMYLMFALVFIVLYLVLGLWNHPQTWQIIAFELAIAVLSVFVNAVFVALYRNRRAVKG